jgi:hypothetical protein
LRRSSALLPIIPINWPPLLAPIGAVVVAIKSCRPKMERAESCLHMHDAAEALNHAGLICSSDTRIHHRRSRPRPDTHFIFTRSSGRFVGLLVGWLHGRSGAQISEPLFAALAGFKSHF